MNKKNHILSKLTQPIIIIRLIGIAVLIVAVVIGVLGFINQHSTVIIDGERQELFRDSFFLGDFYANVSSELASIAITILIVDALNGWRVKRQEKESLILQMGSPINQIAREAVRSLRVRGWLEDGSLKGADISRGNLEDVYLERADLSQTNMYKARLSNTHLQWSNLMGVKGLTDEQFLQVSHLRGAVMPDGSDYDGRYRLKGDLRWAGKTLNFDTNDPESMADFYKIPVEAYVRGQEWHFEQIPKSRTETHFITKEQIKTIQSIVYSITAHKGEQYRIYSQLRKKFNVESYKKLPVDHYQDALHFLNEFKSNNEFDTPPTPA